MRKYHSLAISKWLLTENKKDSLDVRRIAMSLNLENGEAYCRFIISYVRLEYTNVMIVV